MPTNWKPTVGAEHRRHPEVRPHERAVSAGSRAAPAAAACAARSHERGQQHEHGENEPTISGSPQPLAGASTTVRTSISSIAAVLVTARRRRIAAACRDSGERDHARRDEQDWRARRHRQQERPAPAELGQQPPNTRPTRSRSARSPCRRRAPGAVRALRERRGDDREAGGRGEGRAHALEHARDDEQRAVVDQAADGGGDDEHAEPDEQDPPSTEQVGGAAAKQQQPAVAEHVAGHDPLQLGGGETELVADRGQRHADHRDVEAVEEEDAAEHGKERPGAGLPVRSGRSWGGAHPRDSTCMCKDFLFIL